MKLIVKNESSLLEYLYNNISNMSKNNIKSLLKNGVYVNDKKTTKYDYKLKQNDVIEIVHKIIDKSYNKINIIYEDKDLIVIDKPYGMLTISTEKEKEKTLYHFVLEYLKSKKQKVFVVHRLDKETSGVIIFSKNEKMKLILQNNWNELVKTRKYMAIVDGKIEEKEGTYKSFLAENKNHKVYNSNSKDGKLAITKYKKIKENNNYTLVEIEILTGRKNQIRVQFASNNHSIIGDTKYGTSKANRMYLHATQITIVHPITKKEMTFNSNLPDDFNKYMRR